MDRALAAYWKGDMGLDYAERNYSVPIATLKKRFYGANINVV
jgi:helix-turn-helix, Psq domain.